MGKYPANESGLGQRLLSNIHRQGTIGKHHRLIAVSQGMVRKSPQGYRKLYDMSCQVLIRARRIIDERCAEPLKLSPFPSIFCPHLQSAHLPPLSIILIFRFYHTPSFRSSRSFKFPTLILHQITRFPTSLRFYNHLDLDTNFFQNACLLCPLRLRSWRCCHGWRACQRAYRRSSPTDR